MSHKLIITGGAGFIGSHVLEQALTLPQFERVVVIDSLTYAGNKNNLPLLRGNYDFAQANITDLPVMANLVRPGDSIVHLAAESHVDRSITGPLVFTQTNVFGTHVLLEVARQNKAGRFLFVSTDEVYGSLQLDSLPSRETDLLLPRSPYSASKAAAEHLVRAYHHTFGLDTIVTRGSNTYGPRQYPEKIIPLFCNRLIRGLKVPLYGQGTNVRDWMHVQDHARGIIHLLLNGSSGETYNLGGGNQLSNIRLTRKIVSHFGKGDEAIEFVEDRKGHDFRYDLDTTKAISLGWEPKYNFDKGLNETIEWYKQKGVQ
jgi:dTDP-glucose 4,6-dehydratase